MNLKGHFFKPLPQKILPTAVKGAGVYIYDNNGKKYLDGSSGAMTANLGHSLPEVTEKIKKQLDTLSFVFRHQFNNIFSEELSQKVASLTPGTLNRVHFVNSGSEATEFAMKLAKSYWNALGKNGKHMILSRWLGYHGSTVGALSMTGHVKRRQPYHHYLSVFPQLETPFCYHCPFEKTHPGCDLFCARQLEKYIDRFGQDNVSAFIAEPIVGAAGAGITPPDDYFPIIQEICRKKEVLFIMDEVITGFGRTGENFACRHWNVQPDIIVFGKGVSSGYIPLAGAVADEKIYEALVEGGADFSTGHTFSGNPLACAAGCAVVDYIVENELVDRARDKGAYLKSSLHQVARENDLVGDIRGKGLLFGVELLRDKEKREPYPREMKITERLVQKCLHNGLVIYPSTGIINGVSGDSVLLAPPLIVTTEELDELVRIFTLSLHQISQEL